VLYLDATLRIVRVLRSGNEEEPGADQAMEVDPSAPPRLLLFERTAPGTAARATIGQGVR
jgi:hypothetical protein